MMTYAWSGWRLNKAVEKREVDFCIVPENKIDVIIEAKLSDHDIAPTLTYFSKKYNLKAVQVVKNIRNGYEIGKISVYPAHEYLSRLWP